MPQAPSKRWCPTPEQLMILQVMYRSGVRTPTAPQIQQITAHLSYYGRIEGKNVFYWFQNHKARDRQKLRRRLSRHHHLLRSTSHPHSLHFSEETFHSPPPPPPSLPFYLHTLPHFVPPVPITFSSSSSFPLCQCFSGGVSREATEGLNLLCKSKTGGREDTPAMASNQEHGYEWMVKMDMGSAVPLPCRPLKTLDLFPTKSTGLKDEGSTGKSSSRSTSTNLSP